MESRASLDDLEGPVGRNKGLSLQSAPDDVDNLLGQMRQVANGLVLDLAVLAVAASE
jgi:hypothetical protein